MTTIPVKTGRAYNVLIENGIIASCGQHIKSVSNAMRVMVISDSNVLPIYGSKVTESLKAAGFSNVFTYAFTAGEQSKKLSTINEIYTTLAENSFTRKDLIVALGGGVTGDMAGFAAATYLRGIDFVQIPTSLLAQVDSSVGGKTGVDISAGKNLVGAFWQPILVVIDPLALNTLPEKFFKDGMGEVVKYGCIKSYKLFELLENSNPKENIEQIITECISIKRDVVEEDERESGVRMHLNFGHTLGHSLEKLYGFTQLTHGEAVAIGMAIITKASEANGLTAKGVYNRIVDLLEKLGLPYTDNYSIEEIIKNCSNDKKSAGTYINLVLIEDIGEAYVKKIEKTDLNSFFSCKSKR